MVKQKETKARQGRRGNRGLFSDRNTFDSLASKMQKAGMRRVEAECREGREEDVAMLDAFIIDRIRRQEWEEAERRREIERPMLEIPLPEAPLQRPHDDHEDVEEKPQRGVIVIDL